MAFRPSANQQRVLDCKNKNILVSASAGTGKTTVMIEKITGLLKRRQTTLKQLLVVTFTEMAAYEMKKRLVKNLSASDDEDILSQLGQIDTCNISTLHSFCSQLVRKYFVEAEVDPAYKILSDTEWTISYDKVLDDLFEGLYRDHDADFLHLVEVFGKKRKDDELKNLVKTVYNFKTSKADFDGWKNEQIEKYAVADGQNWFVAQYNKNLADDFAKIRADCESLAVQAKQMDISPLVDCFSKLAGNIFISQNKNLQTNMQELIELKVPSFPTRAAEKVADNFAKTEFVLSCKKEKDKMGEVISKYRDFVKNFTYQQILQNMANSCDVCRKLFDLVQKFEDAFGAYKKQNAFLDFADLEHKALKMLSHSQVREEIKNNFKFVFVDEYQDINEIQEEIISLVKGQNNLFLVGDVKQSIYAFRQCAPDIFVGKLKTFGEDETLNHVEFLNDNYRSDFDILDFVNHVFAHLMSDDFGSVDYKATSMLGHPAQNNSGKSFLPAVTIDVICKQKKEDKNDIDTPYSVHAKTKKDAGSAKAEAIQIASRIRQLIGASKIVDGQQKPMTYGDMVILARNMGGGTKQIVAELQSMGIPVVYTARQNLFDSAEIKELVNLFRVADNVYDDIPLYGCLTGFFCSLDQNEIAEIFAKTNEKYMVEQKGEKTEKLLLTRLADYCHEHDDILSCKLKAFLDFLDKVSFLSKHMAVSQLISKICAETDFDLHVLGLPDGAVRLKKLNDFSSSLKDKAYNKSVREFLSFVDAVGDVETDVENSAQIDAVRVMTIHKSKGLEFPVVFVIGCGKKFNLTLNDVICDKKHGFATFAFDTKERAKYDTLARHMLKDKATLAMCEEEMRVLYVALTRAKCHLYLTGCIDSNAKEKKQIDGKSYFDWVLGVLDSHPYQNKEVCFNRFDMDEVVSCDSVYGDKMQTGVTRKANLQNIDDEGTQKIKEMLAHSYAYSMATTMELKAVSSKLHDYQKPQGDEDEILPKVVSKEVDAEDLQQNMIGTGYHLVFEYIDFANKTIAHVDEVIKRLVDEGKLEQKVADVIDKNLIIKALQSPVFDGIQDKKIYRELPFMLKTSYQNLFGGDVDESMFLQGTMDMLILDDTSATIVDYKYTKNPQYIKQNYQKQLDSYAQAVRQILKIKNVKKYVLSLADGKLVEL